MYRKKMSIDKNKQNIILYFTTEYDNKLYTMMKKLVFSVVKK